MSLKALREKKMVAMIMIVRKLKVMWVVNVLNNAVTKLVKSNKKMFLKLKVICLFLLFIACTPSYSTQKIQQIVSDHSLPVEERIKSALSKEYLQFLGVDYAQLDWIQNFYNQRNYMSIWLNGHDSLSVKGQQALEIVSTPLVVGIPNNRMKFPNIYRYNIIEQEVLLTISIGLIINDLKYGFIDLLERKYKSHRMIDEGEIKEFLKRTDTQNIEQCLLKYTYKNDYQINLIKQLKYFMLKYMFSSKSTHYKTITKQNLSEILQDRFYLTEKTDDSIQMESALIRFKTQNGLTPNGQMDYYTIKALNETNYDKVLRTCLVMDKIRQQKDYPEKYIRVNIPEYQLYFIKQNKMLFSSKLIVGKPKNPTPVLQSIISKIIIYPYWYVPHSISAKEILPILKRNRGYLYRNQMLVYYRGKRIHSGKINWKRIPPNTFPYQLVQKPGKNNSLGILKFEFYNNYHVYLHDTPQKKLFESAVRAFSHGCIRCEKPVQLAKQILTNDSLDNHCNKISVNTLDSLLHLSKNMSIRLLQNIPIFIEYQTVYIQNGQLVFGIDIYGKDEHYLKFMR